MLISSVEKQHLAFSHQIWLSAWCRWELLKQNGQLGSCLLSIHIICSARRLIHGKTLEKVKKLCLKKGHRGFNTSAESQTTTDHRNRKNRPVRSDTVCVYLFLWGGVWKDTKYAKKVKYGINKQLKTFRTKFLLLFMWLMLLLFDTRHKENTHSSKLYYRLHTIDHRTIKMTCPAKVTPRPQFKGIAGWYSVLCRGQSWTRRPHGADSPLVDRR